MFCEICDAVLVPKDGVLTCLDCGNSMEDPSSLEKYIIKDESTDSLSRIEIVEQTEEFEGITKEIRDELREQYREALGNGSD